MPHVPKEPKFIDGLFNNPKQKIAVADFFRCLEAEAREICKEIKDTQEKEAFEARYVTGLHNFAKEYDTIKKSVTGASGFFATLVLRKKTYSTPKEVLIRSFDDFLKKIPEGEAKKTKEEIAKSLEERLDTDDIIMARLEEHIVLNLPDQLDAFNKNKRGYKKTYEEIIKGFLVEEEFLKKMADRFIQENQQAIKTFEDKIPKVLKGFFLIQGVQSVLIGRGTIPPISTEAERVFFKIYAAYLSKLKENLKKLDEPVSAIPKFLLRAPLGDEIGFMVDAIKLRISTYYTEQRVEAHKKAAQEEQERAGQETKVEAEENEPGSVSGLGAQAVAESSLSTDISASLADQESLSSKLSPPLEPVDLDAAGAQEALSKTVETEAAALGVLTNATPENVAVESPVSLPETEKKADVPPIAQQKEELAEQRTHRAKLITPELLERQIESMAQKAREKAEAERQAKEAKEAKDKERFAEEAKVKEEARPKEETRVREVGMQSQEDMEGIIAAKKQEMNEYLTLQKKIKQGGHGRAGYLKFFENGSEIVSYYNRLIEKSDGKEEEYREAQRVFNKKLNENVALLIKYRKQRTYKPKEDGKEYADESSREFEQFVELCQLDQKPFDEWEDAMKQFVAKWFTMTVINLEDYEKCIARREELSRILAFENKKYPKNNLLITELKKAEKHLITIEKNFIKRQIRFLNSRDRVCDIELIKTAERTLKLVSGDKSFGRFFEDEVLPGSEDKPFDKTFTNEKKKLEEAIQAAKMFNYCKEKFLENPDVILNRFRDIASENTNPFKAAIQESVRGKDIERLQKCIKEGLLNSRVNIDQYYKNVHKVIDELLDKMKHKSKFGRVGMGNFETVLRALKTEIAEASRPGINFGEQLSAATSELREKPTEHSVGNSLIHSNISDTGEVDDLESTKNKHSDVENKRSRPSQSREME